MGLLAKLKPLPGLMVVLSILALSGPIPTSADNMVIVTPPAPDVQCGCTTCGNPCNVPPVPSPPPPSPPPPPPPSPPPPLCPPPPAALPPPPRCPSASVCPQLPSSNTEGQPGNLYPIDPIYYPSAATGGSVGRLHVLLLGYGLFMLLGF